MANAAKRSFVTYYDLGLKRKRWNCVTLSRKMKELGQDITPRTLQRYRTGETRPTFTTAKTIFIALDIDATDDQIKTSLIVEADRQHKITENNPYFQRGVRIRISSLSSDPDEDNASILLRLKERMRETQGTNSDNFNKYVTNLIKYDMENHVLPKYSDDEDEGDDVNAAA